MKARFKLVPFDLQDEARAVQTAAVSQAEKNPDFRLFLVRTADSAAVRSRSA